MYTFLNVRSFNYKAFAGGGKVVKINSKPV